MIKLKVFNSVFEIADYTFDLLTHASTAALSFGSTYDAIFHQWNDLFSAERCNACLPNFFPVDERLVDITDPGSNWGAVRKLFIDEHGTDADRSRWASDAETFRRFLGDYFTMTILPIFDLLFLGIGPDGHTASLFPNGCPADTEAAWKEAVLETTAPFIPPKRLTLGPEVIASAKQLVVTVTGSSKADIFKRFLNDVNAALVEDTIVDILPPAKIIKRREALGLITEILCDQAAADKLSEEIINKITNRVGK